jgi:P27 family predicted phage terminase small subunit
MKNAPKGLGKAGRTLWNDALDAMEFDALELNLLRHACGAADEAQKAKEALERDGYVITDARGKLVENPMYLVLRDSRNCLSRLLRQLEPKQKATRKPRGESWGMGL